MTAVFRQIEFVLVGKPGQLRRKLVTLALGSNQRKREVVAGSFIDTTLDAADVIEIGHDPLARVRQGLAGNDGIARRHDFDHAFMLAVISPHESTMQVNGHTAVLARFGQFRVALGAGRSR